VKQSFKLKRDIRIKRDVTDKLRGEKEGCYQIRYMYSTTHKNVTIDKQLFSFMFESKNRQNKARSNKNRSCSRLQHLLKSFLVLFTKGKNYFSSFLT
jgi:hypothetical protein